MLRGAHTFVAIVFVALAFSFIATTVSLALEFKDAGWLNMLAIDSHLFLFYPTFGIIALVAFYLPAVAFVDHYWRSVSLGKLRFLAGLLALVWVANAVSGYILDTPNRSVWELKPEVLLADTGQPETCGASGDQTCDRLPLLPAIENLRKLATTDVTLADFVRDCSERRLIERHTLAEPRRYCVVTTRFSQRPDLVDDATCCAAQQSLVDEIMRLHADPANRSVTAQVHAALLPLKVFFLVMLFAISLLLSLHFDAVAKAYSNRLLAIEIGLIIGTIATLFFPLMAQAFVQSLKVFAGEAGRGAFSMMVPWLSAGFGLWTLLNIVYFLRDDKKAELLAKVGSGVLGLLALLKYDVVVSYLVWIIGNSATVIALTILAILTIIVVLCVWTVISWAAKTRTNTSRLPHV
ncbi:MAG: hypothetical protein ACFCUN_02660 [Hyphomicrobiaceae bacterium]